MDRISEENQCALRNCQEGASGQCQAYREQYGMNAIYLLPVNLYGEGDNFDAQSSHVIPALIRKCVEAVDEGRREIVCWGDGTATREFLYVDDCAEAILGAAQRYDQADPVNLGSGREIAIRDVAEMVAHLDWFSWPHYLGHLQTERTAPSMSGYLPRGARVWLSRLHLAKTGLRKTIEWYLVGRRSQLAMP